MKHVLIVEDNPKASRLLQKILKEINENIETEAVCNVEDAKKALHNTDFNLFVVDIILHPSDPTDASGLDFVEYLRGIKRYEYAPVVITTSVVEMKEHAYDILDCYKYLEKPYDHKRAKEVLEKALNMPINYDAAQYLRIRCDGIVRVIRWSDIVMVSYDDRKITIQMTNGSLCAYYKSLSEIYSMLSDRKFLKCSNSMVVNKDFVSGVDKRKGIIYMIKPFESVKVGVSFRKKVFDELLGSKGLK